ncbi:putative colorectal mutant cancer protein isoform X4 [Apostichopus japonicus]|uniref:Putative colorectal mutant cancer protein isoform X4 n=1 Tax=Stichopus japonicus TaxID=307972 RepID=A0A2G8KT07_STIJA|nr:putative colorectal mutant cancer protein isoform X4 [Apostichopus japonicus]
MDDRNIPADMAEMMRRERKLKGRINELVLTLEKLQRSSEMRHQQSADFVADLKRANSAFVTAYGKAMKKHQSRLKKVEAQMMAMVERHDTQVKRTLEITKYYDNSKTRRGRREEVYQVRMLKQRSALLEENQIRPIHNESHYEHLKQMTDACNLSAPCDEGMEASVSGVGNITHSADAEQRV